MTPELPPTPPKPMPGRSEPPVAWLTMVAGVGDARCRREEPRCREPRCSCALAECSSGDEGCAVGPEISATTRSPELAARDSASWSDPSQGIPRQNNVPVTRGRDGAPARPMANPYPQRAGAAPRARARAVRRCPSGPQRRPERGLRRGHRRRWSAPPNPVAQTRPAHAHLRHLAEGHSRASRRESSGIPHFRRVRSPVAPPRTRENWLRRESGDAERPKPWPKLRAGLGGGSGRGRRSRSRSARSSRSTGMRLPFHTTLAMGDTQVSPSETPRRSSRPSESPPN